MERWSRRWAAGMRQSLLLLVTVAGILLPRAAAAQALTGTLIGTIRDAQGGVLPGARVRLSSPALIGGPMILVTTDTGRLRFLALPPGPYALDVELTGFRPHHEDIQIRPNDTIDVAVVLRLAGVAESVLVPGSRIEARDPGFVTHVDPEDLKAIPMRRSSLFDPLRAAPGVSPTSPSSGFFTTVSAFGSGTNENQFLFDGTNITCPCNGVARVEPGVDFIQAIQIQSMGASAEFGNLQGAVINVITKQGSEKVLSDLSYYGQTAGLTSQPVRLSNASGQLTSGYERARYRDVTATLGGPAIRNRLWFFAGYQHLRDYDSQPGTDPKFPRKLEQDRVFGKLTWNLAPGWQLVQSFHDEHGDSPDPPTIATPFEATVRHTGDVPAMTFGHLTHTVSANTLWDVRVGRFSFSKDDIPGTGIVTIPSRFDRATGVTSDAPPRYGSINIKRTTAKSTLSHYRAGFLGANHEWKIGGQVERGEHHSIGIIPTGERFETRNGVPLQRISSPPAEIGGAFVTAAAFGSDAVTIGDRLTITAGVRFDHTRAMSQDLHALDPKGRETDAIVPGLGTLYTWNLFSPRLGATTKLTADGRTLLRASYGRFIQGVLTGELEPFHPGAKPVTMVRYDPATGGYTGVSVTVDPAVNLRYDPALRAPRTDEYSIGVDRAIGRQVSTAIAYVHKDGENFIGWTDTAGRYLDATRTLADGRSVPVKVLDTTVTPPGARRFQLTNPDGYSLTYNGLVMVVEKRRSHGWQASGSYTLSRAYGLLPSSGATAAGPQVSTVSPPQPLIFGRDPNDLTNARGRLPNDRPHMFRVMGSMDVPRTGIAIAANLQAVSGKPWAAAALITLPQADQRILLEPRGSERLSSQTLLDVRLSKAIRISRLGRVEVLVDLLNLLDDTAEESLATDILATETVARNPDFGKPNAFVDPRRAMVSVRMNLGR